MIPRLLPLLGLLLALCPGPAAAFFFIETAYEYVHETNGHYRLVKGFGGLPSNFEPGWIATGYSFEVGQLGSATPVVDVCHFRVPSTESHFYTARPGECDFLRQHATGWVFQDIPFTAGIPGDGGCGAQKPVYRLYNNRGMFGDPNHRFAPDPGERTKLLASGWVDEGIAFCTRAWYHQPLVLFGVSVNSAAGPPCAEKAGSCVTTYRLPPFTASVNAFLEEPRLASNPAYPWQSHALTGMPTDGQAFIKRLATAQPIDDLGAILSHSFVQSDGGSFGIRVNGADRVASDYSSIDPQFRFGTREFPFASSREPYISVSFQLQVTKLDRPDASSHAYGGPVLLFTDSVSGRSLQVALLAYSSMRMGDGVEPPGRDARNEHVMVATTFRANPSFGERAIGDMIFCPGSGACAPAPTNYFTFAIDRAAFQVALDRARTLEPELSGDPASYLLGSFHFRNEVFRDADVGLWLASFQVGLFNR